MCYLRECEVGTYSLSGTSCQIPMQRKDERGSRACFTRRDAHERALSLRPDVAPQFE